MTSRLCSVRRAFLRCQREAEPDFESGGQLPWSGKCKRRGRSLGGRPHHRDCPGIVCGLGNGKMCGLGTMGRKERSLGPTHRNKERKGKPKLEPGVMLCARSRAKPILAAAQPTTSRQTTRSTALAGRPSQSADAGEHERQGRLSSRARHKRSLSGPIGPGITVE